MTIIKLLWLWLCWASRCTPGITHLSSRLPVPVSTLQTVTGHWMSPTARRYSNEVTIDRSSLSLSVVWCQRGHSTCVRRATDGQLIMTMAMTSQLLLLLLISSALSQYIHILSKVWYTSHAAHVALATWQLSRWSSYAWKPNRSRTELGSVLLHVACLSDLWEIVCCIHRWLFSFISACFVILWLCCIVSCFMFIIT